MINIVIYISTTIIQERFRKNTKLILFTVFTSMQILGNILKWNNLKMFIIWWFTVNFIYVR